VAAVAGEVVAEGAGAAVSAAADDANRVDAVTNAASARAANIVPRSRSESVRGKKVTEENVRGARAGEKSGQRLVNTAREVKVVSATKDVVRKEDVAPKEGAATDPGRNDRKAVRPSVARVNHHVPRPRDLPRSPLRMSTISEPVCSTRGRRPRRQSSAKTLTKSLLANRQASGERLVPMTSAVSVAISRNRKSAKTSKTLRSVRKPAARNALKKASVRLVGDGGGDVRVHDATERLDRWIGRDK
jgi:hypothetical protein